MRVAALLSALLIATAAAAQQRPIFDPDDFLHPAEHDGPIVTSRLIAGAVKNYADDYRALHDDAGFLLLTNSVYWSDYQFDYKHSEVRPKNAAPDVRVCACNPPLYFPTPPLADATPSPPAPGPRETMQFGWYRRVAGAPGDIPVRLRYRFTWSRQSIDTDAKFLNTEVAAPSRRGHEQSLGLDADTYFRLGGRDIFGSVQVARTVRSGTPDDRSQTELTYTNRFPGVAWHRVLFRANLTVGGISGRGATGLNLVNPSFEAFWHDSNTSANVHVIWSPQSTRSGIGGWETHHQIAVFVDRALFVKAFRRSPSADVVASNGVRRK